jgi:hypothetical protein
MIRRILLLISFIAMGCGKAKEPEEWVEITEPEDGEIISQEKLQEKFDEGLTKLESVTNVYRQPVEKRGPVTQPQIRRTLEEIELADLGLVLRRVKLAPTVEGISVIFFSETEITNQMYASFLNETGKYRDDTEVEKAAAGEFTTFKSGGKTWSTFSTGSPSIQVKDASSLWRNGKFPESRGDHPVSCVTIDEATEFCKWLGIRYSLERAWRLPTEEEWLSAAYGTDRRYPWGEEPQKWDSSSTVPVKSRPELGTPDELFGMWGNVSELVLSASNGYGGKIDDKYSPFITKWLGPSYTDEVISGHSAQPRQDYWGYTHSLRSRSDEWGFRIVFIPRN